MGIHKLQEEPTKENTVMDEKQIVFPVKYAKPKLLGDIFNVSYSTINRLLKDYDQDSLGIKDLYYSISSTLILINVEKFDEYLAKRHKKWL
ncbi:helix-turn-helix domain-containing protein [Staphylococcus gallinarum]|uniref:helix-turn-helix domain-containing protein n=1 Tax=Staphylococcus gallinarum TaxID=1293 RepID=UPI001E2B9BCB|nr:helix-turn-helix domain-containing protein [Staphylococcus gallinarum]MCD8899430.1 helix-turn-helix domain-containing protein [Staphylococcus gallinarum]